MNIKNMIHVITLQTHSVELIAFMRDNYGIIRVSIDYFIRNLLGSNLSEVKIRHSSQNLSHNLEISSQSRFVQNTEISVYATVLHVELYETDYFHVKWLSLFTELFHYR